MTALIAPAAPIPTPVVATPIVLALGVPQTFAISFGGQTYEITLTVGMSATGGVILTADAGAALETDSGAQIEVPTATIAVPAA